MKKLTDRLSLWTDWESWGIGLGIDTGCKTVSLEVGPFILIWTWRSRGPGVA